MCSIVINASHFILVPKLMCAILLHNCYVHTGGFRGENLPGH